MKFLKRWLAVATRSRTSSSSCLEAKFESSRNRIFAFSRHDDDGSCFISSFVKMLLIFRKNKQSLWRQNSTFWRFLEIFFSLAKSCLLFNLESLLQFCQKLHSSDWNLQNCNNSIFIISISFLVPFKLDSQWNYRNGSRLVMCPQRICTHSF